MICRTPAVAIHCQYWAPRESRLHPGDSPLPVRYIALQPPTRSAVHNQVERDAPQTVLELPAHPQMLQHAFGFDLANKGVDTRTIQDYLGHRSIQHTVRYNQLTPHRFGGTWF